MKQGWKIRKKIKNLRKNLSFSLEECNEIAKIYRGDDYDKSNPAILKFYEVSQKICQRYNELSNKIRFEKDEAKRKSYLEEKNNLFSVIFPIHGKSCFARGEIDAYVGLVDLGRNVYFNRNVAFSKDCLVEIGDSATFSHNIKVGFLNGAEKVPGGG